MSNPAENAEKTTLDNLQAAFEGESNAAAKYTAYAVKADEEGYQGAASLFRAAAHAERVHVANHAAVIKAQGATPQAVIAEPNVQSTLENLKDALAGETHEYRVMYPEFLIKARGDRDKAAIRTFAYAKAAEESHARYYQAAIDGLEEWRAPKEFYVCRVCGETVTMLDFEKCPVCKEPVSEFDKIS